MIATTLVPAFAIGTIMNLGIITATDRRIVLIATMAIETIAASTASTLIRTRARETRTAPKVGTTIADAIGRQRVSVDNTASTDITIGAFTTTSRLGTTTTTTTLDSATTGPQLARASSSQFRFFE